MPDHTSQLPAEYRAYDRMLRENVIAFPQCGACRKFHWYPQPACPHCGSDALVWTRAPATGHLYTWTVVHRKLDPEFPGEAPYVVGLVEFDGIPGVRLVTNIVDTPIGDLRLGMQLEPLFDATADAQPAVRFRAVARVPT
jgi:uncharacterized OB-fold protein